MTRQFVAGTGTKIALAGFALVAAALAVAGGASAGTGTGTEILTENPGGAPWAATDLLRLGATDDGTNLYLWLKVNEPTGNVPDGGDMGGVSGYALVWELPPPQAECYGVRIGYNGVGFPGAAIQGYDGCQAGGAIGTAGVAWFCNELRITVPKALIQNPAQGTILTFPGPQNTPAGSLVQQYSYLFPNGAVHDFFDPGGTYTLGTPGPVLQNPPAALDVQATGDNAVTISWTAPADTGATDIKKYYVYRNGVKIGETTTTSFVDDDADWSTPAKDLLTSLQKFDYQVSSVNCVGESAKTTVYSIKPDFRPEQPMVALGTVSPTAVPLSWTIPGDAPSTSSLPPGTGASGVASTQVYRSPDNVFGDGDDVLLATPTSSTTSYTDTGMASPGTHYYAVRSVDAQGNYGPYSLIKTAFVPQAPDTVAPTAVTLSVVPGSATDTSFKVQWTTSSDSGTGVSNYLLRCAKKSSSVPSAAPVVVGTTPPLEHVLGGLTPETQYYCRVQAKDGASNLAVLSNEVTVKTLKTGALPDALPPAKPNLSVSGVGLDYANLGWPPVLDDVAVAYYEVFRSSTTPVSSTGVLVGTTLAENCFGPCGYADLGITSGATYHYAVRAVDTSGNVGPLSNEVSATTTTATDTAPPTTPTLTALTAPDGTKTQMEWTKATDPSGILSYDIVRDGVLVQTVGSGTACLATCSWADNGVMPETTYSYRVRARDGSGNLGLLSNTLTVTTPKSSDTTPPGSPPSITATPMGADRIDVSWTSAPDTGGSGLLEYRIYRSLTGSPDTTKPAFATVPATVTSYPNVGLAGGTQYWYAVRAVDKAGNLGPASSAATATTAAGPPVTELVADILQDEVVTGVGNGITLTANVGGGHNPLTCTWTGIGGTAIATAASCAGAVVRFDAAGHFFVKLTVVDGVGDTVSAQVPFRVGTGSGVGSGVGGATGSANLGVVTDFDLDGLANLEDNCPHAENMDQADQDLDGAGDVCDGNPLSAAVGAIPPLAGDEPASAPAKARPADRDGDGIPDGSDNCPDKAGLDRADLDGDLRGDLCDGDLDGDTVDNSVDNCPRLANPDQEDRDGDLLGDRCDGAVLLPATPDDPEPVSEPPAGGAESQPVWPWVAGGAGLLALVGAGIAFALLRSRAGPVGADATAPSPSPPGEEAVADTVPAQQAPDGSPPGAA